MGKADKTFMTTPLAVSLPIGAGFASNPHAVRATSPQFEKISAEIAELSVFGHTRVPEAKVERFELTEAELGRALNWHLASRRRRAQFFPADLFADPAWDILLDVFLAEVEQRRVSISSVCAAACVPPTTALRWIKTMTGQGLFTRSPDFNDGRRFYLQLSTLASRSMRNYFSEILHAPKL